MNEEMNLSEKINQKAPHLQQRYQIEKKNIDLSIEAPFCAGISISFFNQ